MSLIWIDVSNAPHVAFASKLAEIYGIESLFVTSRPFGNLEPLLRLKGIPFVSVGGHYGRSRLRKVFGLFWRAWLLARVVRKKNVCVAFSQSSFYSPIVARLCGIKSLYTNDNEHALGNCIALLLADVVLFPDLPPFRRGLHRWAIGRKTFYKGPKEAFYLEPISSRPSRDNLRSVFFRPPPWGAQYLAKNDSSREVEEIIECCHENQLELVILCRDSEQHKFFLGVAGDHASVTKPENVYELNLISEQARLFVGAGGTMTRELVLQGVPAISIYSGSPLAIDRSLRVHGLVFCKEGDLKRVFEELVKFDFSENEALYSDIRSLVIDEIERLGLSSRGPEHL